MTWGLGVYPSFDIFELTKIYAYTHNDIYIYITAHHQE